MGATVMTGTVLRHQVEWAAQIGGTRLGARVILHAQRRNDRELPVSPAVASRPEEGLVAL